MKKAWIISVSETGARQGRTVAIADSQKGALAWSKAHPDIAVFVTQVIRSTAVSEIRRQVYDRDEGRCVQCGERVTFEQMHMHERQSRGNGGAISVENSETRCCACHLGPRALRAHGGRRPRFGEKTKRTRRLMKDSWTEEEDGEHPELAGPFQFSEKGRESDGDDGDAEINSRSGRAAKRPHGIPERCAASN